MSPSRSRSLLEGKDLVSLGFGGNAGAEAIFAGEVYRPADPVLERLLDAAVRENAADHGSIHLDEDVDVTVWPVLAARSPRRSSPRDSSARSDIFSNSFRTAETREADRGEDDHPSADPARAFYVKTWERGTCVAAARRS